MKLKCIQAKTNWRMRKIKDRVKQIPVKNNSQLLDLGNKTFTILHWKLGHGELDWIETQRDVPQLFKKIISIFQIWKRGTKEAVRWGQSLDQDGEREENGRGGSPQSKVKHYLL